MAVTSYATLQTAITTWAMRENDSDFTDHVTDFITQAEHLINYGDGEAIPPLRTRDMETVATVTLTNGAGTLPTDYLEFRRVRTLDATPIVLDPVSPELGTQEYGASSAGKASYFDIVGSTITTWPPSATNISLTYFAKVPALSDSQTTNWLLTKSPFVYLYGSLVAAAPFMMDDARIQTWGTLYTKLIKGLMLTDQRAKYAMGRAIVRGVNP